MHGSHKGCQMWRQRAREWIRGRLDGVPAVLLRWYGKAEVNPLLTDGHVWKQRTFVSWVPTDICVFCFFHSWVVQRPSNGAQAVAFLPCWVLPFPSPAPCRGHYPAGWRPQPWWRQGGSLLQWRLGHSVWWWLDRPRCPGGLQAAGLQVGLRVCVVSVLPNFKD